MGPGSYTGNSPVKEHGFAPFQSTAPRLVGGNSEGSASYTPGPGYYETTSRSDDVQQLLAMRTSSCSPVPFNVNAPRIAVDKSTAQRAPGPGAYKGGGLEPQWLRKSHRWALLSEVFFQIKYFIFWILWSYKYIFLIIKINNFRGDLSDISAKTATLVSSALVSRSVENRCGVFWYYQYCSV